MRRSTKELPYFHLNYKIRRNSSVLIRGDGETVRDYIYIDDLAEGMLTALEHGVCNEIYNIGSSIGRSNLEIVQAIKPQLKDIGINR